MTLEKKTELTYFAAHIHSGVLTTARVKYATVILEDGVEISRKEGDEEALPNDSDLAAHIGESLAASVAAVASLKSELEAEKSAHRETYAQAHATVADLERIVAELTESLKEQSEERAKLAAQLEQLTAPAKD